MRNTAFVLGLFVMASIGCGKKEDAPRAAAPPRASSAAPVTVKVALPNAKGVATPNVATDGGTFVSPTSR
ncbi:MAG: hypothetical protein JWP87_3758 [Labilithrix sp.]|nr:hypothetical protein [Labilithrix sp.]